MENAIRCKPEVETLSQTGSTINLATETMNFKLYDNQDCMKSTTWLTWVRREKMRMKTTGISSLAGTEPEIAPPPQLQHTL